MTARVYVNLPEGILWAISARLSPLLCSNCCAPNSPWNPWNLLILQPHDVEISFLNTTMWGPQTIAKLVNNSNNYVFFCANNELVFMGFMFTNIHTTFGGPHCMLVYWRVAGFKTGVAGFDRFGSDLEYAEGLPTKNRYWLVVFRPTPLKNDGVSNNWDDYSIPNMMGKS